MLRKFHTFTAMATPAVTSILLLLGQPALAAFATQSNVPRANSVIEATAYVSLEPVPRGRTFELAVVLRIRPGFHVNAHTASEDFLIPTEVTAELPAGFRALATNYPQGELRKFQFSQKKLNVYQDNVTVRVKVEALDSAPLGAQKLAFRVRYQACTNEVCLPPVNLPVTAELQVAEAGSKSRAVHPELFSPAQHSGHTGPHGPSIRRQKLRSSFAGADRRWLAKGSRPYSQWLFAAMLN